MGLAQIDAGGVFCFVLVQNGVTLIIPRLADQPTEDAASVFGVGHPRVPVLAIKCQDVVFGERSPMGVSVTQSRPPFNPSEKTFDAGTVPFDAIFDSRRRLRGAARWAPTPGNLDQNRNEVFSSGQNENIRVIPIFVFRQTFVGFPGDRWQLKPPTEAEWAIARSGVVGERKLRAETGAAGTCRDGNRY